MGGNKMYDKVVESVNYIKNLINNKPVVAVILGSGLGNLANVVENRKIIDPYPLC